MKMLKFFLVTLLTVYSGIGFTLTLNESVALALLNNTELKKLKADPKVINAASRKEEIVPYPPPGLKKIVVSRSI